MPCRVGKRCVVRDRIRLDAVRRKRRACRRIGKCEADIGASDVGKQRQAAHLPPSSRAVRLGSMRMASSGPERRAPIERAGRWPTFIRRKTEDTKAFVTRAAESRVPACKPQRRIDCNRSRPPCPSPGDVTSSTASRDWNHRGRTCPDAASCCCSEEGTWREWASPQTLIVQQARAATQQRFARPSYSHGRDNNGFTVFRENVYIPTRGLSPRGATMGDAVTIKDVARRANVSVATVSRALNGHHNVATAVRERVLGIAGELQYRPHHAARSLSSRRTHTIGVVLPDLYGEFFSELIRGIDGVARERGLHLLVSSCHGHPEEL